jgi:hypothetical protein
MVDTIQLLTITNSSRCIGIDSTEIARAMVDERDIALARDAIGELVKAGRFYELEEMLGGHPETDFRSILLLDSGIGKEAGVAVAGTIDIIKVNVKDILPLPEYLRKRQDPLFVWGFLQRSRRLVMLVTFQFMIGHT